LSVKQDFGYQTCVNREGGRDNTRPWVGRHYSELESVLPPRWPLQVLVGVDPLVVLGLKGG